MPWFKLYDEAGNDPKLETLTDPQHRVWFKLMCLANRQQKRGLIPPMKERVLAIEVARGDVELLRGTLLALSELDILVACDDGAQSFVNWAKRQARKASDEPDAVRDRVRKHREHKRAAGQGPGEEMKRDVTRYTHDVTRSNALEEEEDKEGDREKESSKDVVVDESRASEKNKPLLLPPPPGGKNYPEAIRDRIALQGQIEAAAADLKGRRLTKAEIGSINRWAATHLSRASPEIVAQAAQATAEHTNGENMAYFFKVMERMIYHPEQDQPVGKGVGTNGQDKPKRSNLAIAADQAHRDIYGIGLDEIQFGGNGTAPPDIGGGHQPGRSRPSKGT